MTMHVFWFGFFFLCSATEITKKKTRIKSMTDNEVSKNNASNANVNASNSPPPAVSLSTPVNRKLYIARLPP